MSRIWFCPLKPSVTEFSYNNSFQASIETAPFEALYGRRCRTPLNWSESGEWAFLGPDLVKEVEDHPRGCSAPRRVDYGGLPGPLG